jgi:hypothetical protein
MRGWAVSRVITVLSVGSFKMRKAGTMMDTSGGCREKRMNETGVESTLI